MMVLFAFSSGYSTNILANRDCVFKVKTAVLTGAACGKDNGSILVTSFEADVPSQFSWLDENDREVSTQRNLIGFKPGTYRLFGADGLG
ncbi:MAG: hypothetical protein ACQUHE_17310, partial [Bacteroidia bacterium]